MFMLGISFFFANSVKYPHIPILTFDTTKDTKFFDIKFSTKLHWFNKHLHLDSKESKTEIHESKSFHKNKKLQLSQ